MEKDLILTEGALKVSCKLSAPDHGPIQRVVLGVHGLAGSANDQIQTIIAEEMAMFRCAVLRFDFPGHGDSPMPELTLKDSVDSLLTVARYARDRFPEVEDLCIFATGFGAYVTLIALEELTELPGQVKLVIQTPCVRMHDTLLSMLRLTEERFWVMERITLPLPRPLDVTHHFYQELTEHLALTPQPIPILILHCDCDEYIRMEDIQHFRRLNDHAKLVIIPGMSHRFTEEGAWDMVLDLTRDWFEYQQVLLTDWI
jgi:alpha-beta hydrolase superfamily lysophospholipase